MIYVRADMNDTIATGHIMRCMAIADAARELGEETTFIVADENAKSLFDINGYRYHVLNTDWSCMDGELQLLIEYLRKEKAKVLLIDSYNVSYKYLEELQKVMKVVYLDDRNSFKYPVDSLICYGVYANNYNYTENYSETKLLLGPQYTPVRKVFSACPIKAIKEIVENILIVSGGTDNENVLEQLPEIAARYPVKKITVICGHFYKKYNDLKAKYRDERVEVIKSVNCIEDYMMDADIVLSAGGNTLYELCACGTPTISFALADNQFGNVFEFDKQGIILYAGDARIPGMIDNADKLMKKLFISRDLREKMSRKMQAVIDGKGAYRLAKELIMEA